MFGILFLSILFTCHSQFALYEARANMNYNLFVVQKCSAVHWNAVASPTVTHGLPNPQKRKPPSLLGRLWPPSSGTLMVHCTWISSKSVAQQTLNIYSELLEGAVKAAIRNRNKGRKYQCHFSRITPVHKWLHAPRTLYRNWNGTLYYILHIDRNLLPQTINFSSP